MLVLTAILGGGVDPSHFPFCIAMSHSLTLLAHCQGLVSQIGQTLLTAQQIAWLGGTEQVETLFVVKQICKTTFLEGISYLLQ